MPSLTDEALRTRLRALADLDVGSIQDVEEDVRARCIRRRRRRRVVTTGCGLAIVLAGVGTLTLVRADGPSDLSAGDGGLQSTQPTAAETSASSAPANATVSVQAIEIHAGLGGGEDIVFVFDGQLPDDRVTFARDITQVDGPGIAYAVQNSRVLVCADTHDFGGGGSIDILIPSEWWTPGQPVHDVPYVWDPPIDRLPEELDSPGKIVGCGPYRGYMQYSIWAPSSDDPGDIEVSVQGGSTRLRVRVRP